MKIVHLNDNMKIETTINLRTEIKKRILLASARSGISCSDIVMAAMRFMVQEIDRGARLGTRVKYQPRCDDGEWKNLHVQLGPEDYEFFLDMKKFMKMSVSYIISRAIKKHLNEILKTNITDNNPLSGYSVIFEKFNEIRSWRILWGKATDIRKTTLHPLLL